MTDEVKDQCPPDTTGLVYVRTQRGYESMHKTTEIQVRWSPSTEKETGHRVQPLTKKLIVIDNCQKMEN